MSIIAISGWILAMILGIKDIFIWYKSRANIEIELSSWMKDFRNRCGYEKNILVAVGDSESTHLPEKLLYFDVSFHLTNKGEKSIGIKDIYLEWADPIVNEMKDYTLRMFDVGERKLIPIKRKSFPLSGGDTKHMFLKQELDYNLQALLFRKNIFQHKLIDHYKYHEYVEKVPEKLFLNIVVVDQFNKKHIKRFNIL